MIGYVDTRYIAYNVPDYEIEEIAEKLSYAIEIGYRFEGLLDGI